jgi:hypothetical protein
MLDVISWRHQGSSLAITFTFGSTSRVRDLKERARRLEGPEDITTNEKTATAAKNDATTIAGNM